MSSVNQNRVMARQVAEVRELSLEELQLIAGGGGTTDTGQSCDWSLGCQESMCGSSGDDPCDEDWLIFD